MKPLSIQPLPYQGSKRRLAPEIARYIPNHTKRFIEPFAGSAAMSLFVAQYDLVKKIIIGDQFAPIIDLWEMIVNDPERVIRHYSQIWHAQDGNSNHYHYIRSLFNHDLKSGISANPMQFLYLAARCTKNAIRFNHKGEFNATPDKRRKGIAPQKLEKTIHQASDILKGRVSFFRGDFQSCIADAKTDDLVYMDPPYEGTSRGADKRYAAQLDRDILIQALENLNRRKIPWILSYDGRMGEKTYGEPLPSHLEARRFDIKAGRSSQATLVGKKVDTFEALYVKNYQK